MTSSWLGPKGFAREDKGRRGRELQMSTCRLKVLEDRRGAQHTYPSNSANSDTFGGGGSGQGRKAATL